LARYVRLGFGINAVAWTALRSVLEEHADTDDGTKVITVVRSAPAALAVAAPATNCPSADFSTALVKLGVIADAASVIAVVSAACATAADAAFAAIEPTAVRFELATENVAAEADKLTAVVKAACRCPLTPATCAQTARRLCFRTSGTTHEKKA
jgi:hypothetical protein